VLTQELTSPLDLHDLNAPSPAARRSSARRGVIVILLIAAAVGLATWHTYYAKQKRQEGHFALAVQYGLEYSQHDPYLLPEWYGFHPFRMGEGRGMAALERQEPKASRIP